MIYLEFIIIFLLGNISGVILTSLTQIRRIRQKSDSDK